MTWPLFVVSSALKSSTSTTISPSDRNSLRRTAAWYTHIHSKSAVTKFWVSRLIIYVFIRPLSFRIWNGENASEAFNWKCYGNNRVENVIVWRRSIWFGLTEKTQTFYMWCRVDGSCSMQNSDPMQSMRWTDYHFWIEIEMQKMKWKCSGMSAVPFGYGQCDALQSLVMGINLRLCLSCSARYKWEMNEKT